MRKKNFFSTNIDETKLEKDFLVLFSYVKYKIFRKKEFLENFIAFFDPEEFQSNLDALEERKHNINMRQTIEKFNFIDWEETTDIKNIVQHFYTCALFEMRNLKNFEKMSSLKNAEDPNKTKKPLSVFQVTNNFSSAKSNAIFTTKHKPTMTHDEYVDFVTATNNRIIQKAEAKKKNLEDFKNLYQISSESLSEREENSERNDNYQGNLYRQG